MCWQVHFWPFWAPPKTWKKFTPGTHSLFEVSTYIQRINRLFRSVCWSILHLSHFQSVYILNCDIFQRQLKPLVSAILPLPLPFPLHPGGYHPGATAVQPEGTFWVRQRYSRRVPFECDSGTAGGYLLSATAVQPEGTFWVRQRYSRRVPFECGSGTVAARAGPQPPRSRRRWAGRRRAWGRARRPGHTAAGSQDRPATPGRSHSTGPVSREEMGRVSSVSELMPLAHLAISSKRQSTPSALSKLSRARNANVPTKNIRFHSFNQVLFICLALSRDLRICHSGQSTSRIFGPKAISPAVLSQWENGALLFASILTT